MGTPLPMKAKSNFAPTPTVALTAKVGAIFVGKCLQGRKAIKSSFKDPETGDFKMRGVYEFAIEDGDMPVQIKVGPKAYAEVKVKVGDKVSLFPPSRLDGALDSVKVGDRVRIKYLGRDGQAHMFDAELL